jgi:nocturnin
VSRSFCPRLSPIVRARRIAESPIRARAPHRAARRADREFASTRAMFAETANGAAANGARDDADDARATRVDAPATTGDDEKTGDDDDDARRRAREASSETDDDASRYVYDPNRDDASMTTSTSGARTIQVCQYNALADALALNDAFASAYYGEDDAEANEEMYDLNWTKRSKDLLRAITSNDSTTAPDVICMQECDHYYDFFEPELKKLGYAGLYKEDQWSPCRKFGAPCDGVCIFYKTDKLELLSSHAPGTPRARKDDPALNAGKTLMARFRLKKDPRSESGIRNAIGTLIRGNAKPVFSGEDLQEIVVVTTHLESAKTVDGIITRLEQTKELCRHLNAFATSLCADVDIVQIIIAGDLNATPNEACVVHLRGRGMRNAYEDMSAALGDKNSNRFSTWKTRTGLFKTGEVKQTIDYILYSAHRGSKVVSVAKLPDESEIPSDVGLPTFGFPSDHLPLQARIAIPP